MQLLPSLRLADHLTDDVMNLWHIIFKSYISLLWLINFFRISLMANGKACLLLHDNQINFFFSLKRCHHFIISITLFQVINKNKISDKISVVKECKVGY